MPAQSREQLKKYFRNGNLAREEYFADLIDSTVNKVNDQLDITPTGGWNLVAASVSKRFISFFRNNDQLHQQAPSFFFQQITEEKGGEGFSLSSATGNGASKSLLYVKKEKSAGGATAGKIGINTSQPTVELDVNGSVGMKARVGRYMDPTVNPSSLVADGKWHKVMMGLKGLNAFEILAGTAGNGKQFSMVYTVAMNTSGRNGVVKPIQQVRSGWFDRMQLRWAKSSDGTYSLEVRTARKYANKPLIQVRITKLWN
ncbi:MAG: hypothetical protein ACOYXT_11130 [Bacteroidota bacterium]